MKRPEHAEFAAYYGAYVSLVAETDVVSVLKEQPTQLQTFAGSISPERERFRYAPGKWSIRQVVGHINDAERVFGHRAFCIGRGEQQPLPGFDENAYIAASDYDTRPLPELVSEFALVREANLITLKGLSGDDWDRTGTASGHPVSVRALAFIMAGHVRHHMRILSDKYL